MATQLAGRLVTDYRGMVNSGEELYECYGEEIAQKWIEIDADPNPKYNWETVWKSLVVRFFDADKEKPLAPRAESRVKASQNPEVLVMNRFDKSFGGGIGLFGGEVEFGVGIREGESNCSYGHFVFYMLELIGDCHFFEPSGAAVLEVMGDVDGQYSFGECKG